MARDAEAMLSRTDNYNDDDYNIFPPTPQGNSPNKRRLLPIISHRQTNADRRQAHVNVKADSAHPSTDLYARQK